MSQMTEPPASSRRVDFPEGSTLRSISLHTSADGTQWHIHVLPREGAVAPVAFQKLMTRIQDRVWDMAVRPPTPRRYGQGIDGYVNLVAPTNLSLQSDGGFLTSAIPAEKLPAALALTIGVLSRSIETREQADGINAPLLNDDEMRHALDTFSLHAVLQQVKRNLPPAGTVTQR